MSERIRDLEINSLVHGGRGLGHHEGRAVFVAMSAPGDRVDCRVIKAKPRYIEAELVEIITPSPLRRVPPCPYFGTCGGCQWQHLTYDAQTRWKEAIFFDQLLHSRVAAESSLLPMAPSPQEWSYRNRVQFKCRLTTSGLAIGFYRPGSHFVVDIEHCPVLALPLQEVLKRLRAELPDAPSADCVPQVDVEVGDDGAIRILLHTLPAARRQLRPWLQGFALRHRLSACLQSGRKTTLERVHGQADLSIRVDQPAMSLSYGPGGFVQGNSPQNRNLVAEMLAVLELQGTEQVLDLFCGMGNFSLPIARRAARVTGIEAYAPSITSARANAVQHKLDNVDFWVADAARAISREALDGFDLIVLDPPRSGCYPCVADILKISPQRVLYISCDPATLARDLAPLVHGGYEVVSSRPFDLFPQTWHIESMTLLQRTAT